MSMQNHEHPHSHGHHHHVDGKKLGITIFLNLGITIAQTIAGFLSGSLSLLSDATHNFSDVIALIVAWVASKVAQKPYSEKKTFGYKRAEIVAAIINVVTIMIIAIIIFIEAIARMLEPTEVRGMLVILLGGLSIFINAFSAFLIKKEAKNNINMKAAYMHLFSDMLTSVAVLVGGSVIYFTELYWVDTLISVGIASYLIYISWGMLVEAMKIIMEFAPDDIDLEELEKDVLKFSFVKNIHHVHLWQITDRDRKIEMHISFKENLDLETSTKKLEEVKKMLGEKYKVAACTLQAEYGSLIEDKIIDER